MYCEPLGENHDQLGSVNGEYGKRFAFCDPERGADTILESLLRAASSMAVRFKVRFHCDVL